MPDNFSNNKRIAKNTFVLYVRMLFLMVIGLYTSRVVLQVLGVEDFGVYNVVGGFVALFSVLSQSLSSAASRFLTFELGKGNLQKLCTVFSTTLIIHIILALVILFLAEIIGVWFVNTKMVIAPERLSAANWVFQFSLLTFCINLITVPHQASVIAHEKMDAFAFISVLEGVGKLLICILLMVSPIDRLVFYALLMFIIQFFCRSLFYLYCRRNFGECRFSMVYDGGLLKEISGFVGWNMIGSSSAILRNQGINVLLNLFFGPVVNAARALANQVMNVVNGFVENFVMAVRPQITKSYANGEHDYMMTLIFYGSRLSYYMLLVVCMPILMNTDYLLNIWLTRVPDDSALFIQLTLVFTMIETISSPLITAQQATGHIRNYQIVVGGFQLMNFPVSYAILKLGGEPEMVLYVAITLAICSLLARLYMLRKDVRLDVVSFVCQVLLNVLLVTAVSTVLSVLVGQMADDSFMFFIISSFLYVIIPLFTILYVGCRRQERLFIYEKINAFVKRKRQ